jgi:hypothetical protein
MSRIRWILAGLVAVLAVVAAIQATATYARADLAVGVLAVLALAATLVVGLASLARARWRIEKELQALRADPTSTTQPASALLRARRERLTAIQAAGVRPDRQVLAEATAAEEAGRAYIGRYFVATTVLIGLVGTFAGLMATLSKVAPLLGDRDSGGLSLLAGPLAGLHVTFGASLVAILATLSLALAQGDLALHEEQALATLEDRTTHHLIPQLWPPADEPAERTVRAMSEMRSLLAEAVAESLEKSAARMAETSRAEAERAARALETTAATVEKQISALGESVSVAIKSSAGTMEKQTTKLGGAVGGALEASAATVEKQISELGATVGKSLESTVAALEKRINAISKSVGTSLEATVTGVEKRMEALGTGVGGALEKTVSGVEKRMEALGKSVGGALKETTQQQNTALAQAATSLGKQASESAEETVKNARQVAEEVVRTAAHTAEEAVRRASQVAEEAVRSTTAELGRTLQPMLAAEAQRLDLLRESFGQTATGIQQAAERLAELHGVLEGTARAQVAAIENAGQAVMGAFDKAVLGAGNALDGAAGKLATAAQQMSAGVETFTPKIAALASELSALGRELALQSARGPEGDLGAVVLGELERIGAGLDRLAQLHRLAGGGGAPAGPPAAELGAAPVAESFGADATEETPS